MNTWRTLVWVHSMGRFNKYEMHTIKWACGSLIPWPSVALPDLYTAYTMGKEPGYKTGVICEDRIFQIIAVVFSN